MIDITGKYNQEKESTIQYDVSELLQTELSDCLKGSLMNLENSDVGKFVALFPIQSKVKISAIRNLLNDMKEILPKNLFEETKNEVTEICDDYKWMNSKEGKYFPSEHIYIGRSFIEPVSLIVGGYVKELDISISQKPMDDSGISSPSKGVTNTVVSL